MARIHLDALILFVAAIAILGTALLFQYVGGLAPCELCLYQRYPYIVVILAAGLTLVVRRPALARALLLLSGLALLTTAGIGAFHVGVEQHWWGGLAACTDNSAPAGSLDALRAKIMATPVTRCDQVAWSLFGISMAGYNFLLALALGIYGLLAAARREPGLSR